MRLVRKILLFSHDDRPFLCANLAQDRISAWDELTQQRPSVALMGVERAMLKTRLRNAIIGAAGCNDADDHQRAQESRGWPCAFWAESGASEASTARPKAMARTRGPPDGGAMPDRLPVCFSSKALSDARPNRLRVRYERRSKPFTRPPQRAAPR